MEDKCHNCDSTLELVEMKPEYLCMDIKCRIYQNYTVQACSKCNIPHFSKNRFRLVYFTNYEKFLAFVKHVHDKKYIGYVTIEKGETTKGRLPIKANFYQILY
jgi:hypothetical protein